MDKNRKNWYEYVIRMNTEQILKVTLYSTTVEVKKKYRLSKREVELLNWNRN